MRADLGLELAKPGDDVSRLAAADDADVGGRLLVDPPEPEVGDRPGAGDDRAAALLRRDARVGSVTDEGRVQLAMVGRTEDDLADRRRLVVDVAQLGFERAQIEKLGAL